jgi:hypothetical protein
MTKDFLGSLAVLLSAFGLVWCQTPPSGPAPPAEAVAPAMPLPEPAAENAISAPVAQRPAVDRQPWNPSIGQGARWPYQQPPHSWLSGLCPDLNHRAEFGSEPPD